MSEKETWLAKSVILGNQGGLWEYYYVDKYEWEETAYGHQN